MKPVTQPGSLSRLALGGFFAVVRVLTVGLLLLVGVLVASQSAVAPVSARLLGTYALEYTAKTIKPYRHFFPQPYMVNLDEEETR
ncbi:hypothetical protein [Candidatus Avelusimicrobium facis]|uniref:hypothetical protein n=1 Tax=Candidatus Avelusimicrobium facis TaxID=3416203 RepID=UPI003D09C3EE